MDGTRRVPTTMDVRRMEEGGSGIFWNSTHILLLFHCFYSNIDCIVFLLSVIIFSIMNYDYLISKIMNLLSREDRFKAQHDLLDRTQDLYNEQLSKIERSPDTPENRKALDNCTSKICKIVYTRNALIRRENIETRGYDSHSGNTIGKKKIIAYEKKKAELAKLQQSTNNADSDAAEDTGHEQSDKDQPEMTHLHPDVEEYQENLPVHDEPKEIIRNKKIVAPRPIIKYNLDGFRPYAKMCDLFKSHAPTKIAGGTYDAGKTYSCVAYIDMLARQYPGARLTFVHRTLNRIHRNIIPTYEKYLGFRPTSRSDTDPTPIVKYGGELPLFFEYWNGSRIYTNGLDNPQNLLSDYFDAAFVNQAELVPFDSWLEVTARVSERAGTMPIAFLVADCNPSAPNHWIRHQTQAGKVEYFELSYKDNPEIYNQETGELTETGKRRVARLENLEGLRYKRGFEGKWESAEGLVFDTFSPDIHVIDRIKLDKNWRRYISIDWGFRNPSSCIWWAVSTDDRIYAYKEIYKTGLTRTDLIQMIKANCDESDRIYYAAVDSADQDGVAHLKRARFNVKEPKKSRIAQIDAIKQRLKVDETGQPSIYFLRDRLVHPPDEELKGSYRPTVVTEEFLSCVYDENVSGTDKDDEAIKGDHHGIDSTAYLLLSLEQFRLVGSGRVLHSTNGLDVAEGIQIPEVGE